MKNNIFRKILCSVIMCSFVTLHSLYADRFHVINTNISLPCKTTFKVAIKLENEDDNKNKNANISFGSKGRECIQEHNILSEYCPVIYTHSSYYDIALNIITDQNALKNPGSSEQLELKQKTIIHNNNTLFEQDKKDNQYSVELFKKFTDVGEFLYIILYDKEHCSYEEFQKICRVLNFPLDKNAYSERKTVEIKDGKMIVSSNKPRRIDPEYKEWSIHNASLFKINPNIMLKSDDDLSATDEENDIKRIKTAEELINVFEFNEQIKNDLKNDYIKHETTINMKKHGDNVNLYQKHDHDNNLQAKNSELTEVKQELQEVRSMMQKLMNIISGSQQNSSEQTTQAQ